MRPRCLGDADNSQPMLCCMSVLNIMPSVITHECVHKPSFGALIFTTVSHNHTGNEPVQDRLFDHGMMISISVASQKLMSVGLRKVS